MLNQVFIMGNMTRDPELKYLPSGSAVCSFTVAMNHKYKSGEETKEEVSFISVTVFGKMAEACANHLHKGSKVMVQGRLKQDTWEHEGTKREKVKIIAQMVQFLDGKKQGQADGQGDGQGDGEEIPF